MVKDKTDMPPSGLIFNKNEEGLTYAQSGIIMVSERETDQSSLDDKPITNNSNEQCEICVSSRTTYFQTLFHLIKCHIGCGMLAVGDVLHNPSGLLLGPFLTVCLGIMCICDNHIVASCSQELKNRKQLSFFPSFPETMAWAFESGPFLFQRCSSVMREVVKSLNIATQLGCCTVYFIFISSSLQTLLQMLERHGILMDEHVIIVIILFPVVLTIFLSHLQFLTMFTVFASTFMFSAVSLTLYVSSSDSPSIPRPAVAHWSQIPLFFGTSIYCFEGIAKSLPMSGEVAPPTNQPRQHTLLLLVLAIVGSLFVIIALICFVKLVDDVADYHFTARLTFSFSQTYLCGEIVQLTISLALLFSYTLQFHTALMLVWPEFVRDHGPSRHIVLAELGVRLILALSTFVAVEVLPKVGVFVSLTGAVSGTLLALLLPPLCDIALHWDQASRPWKYCFDFFSITIAAAGFFIGFLYIVVFVINGFPDELLSHT